MPPLRVLMLGWDFSARVSSGVGVACAGLVEALLRRGVEVLYVSPAGELHRDATARDHMHAAEADWQAHADALAHVLIENTNRSPEPAERASSRVVGEPASDDPPPSDDPPEAAEREAFNALLKHTAFQWRRVPAALSPYDRPTSDEGSDDDATEHAAASPSLADLFPTAWPRDATDDVAPAESLPPFATWHERPDSDALFAEVDRYTRAVLDAVAGEYFDLIHAHDWPSFPAALALRSQTDRPMIAHVHSTEFDRAARPDGRIYDLERSGCRAADAVLAVSHVTAGVLQSMHRVPADRVSVAYPLPPRSWFDACQCDRVAVVEEAEPLVLYLGRVTEQKGVMTFLQSAADVLQRVPAAWFVIAGGGPDVWRMLRLADGLGIADRVIYTGMLPRDEVHRMLRLASVYVAPSRREPFGLSSLEAISLDVPTIVTRGSGISERFQHVLRVPPDDAAALADTIANVLQHPPLKQVLRPHGSMSVRQIAEEDAAEPVLAAYRAVVDRRGAWPTTTWADDGVGDDA